MRLRVELRGVSLPTGQQLQLMPGDELAHEQLVVRLTKAGEAGGCERTSNLPCDAGLPYLQELASEVIDQLVVRGVIGATPRLRLSYVKHRAPHGLRIDSALSPGRRPCGGGRSDDLKLSYHDTIALKRGLNALSHVLA
jgi:hypothetical protein